MTIAVICGGVGAARFLTGVVRVVDPASVTAIVNVADDFEHLGLSISPDLDTITYTLAEIADHDRGWGLAGESWQAMAMLEALGGPAWFSLGDRDLGTHLYRTNRLRDGASLSAVTAEITARHGIPTAVLPASDDRIRTTVVTRAHGELDFQQYFVGHRHAVAVEALRFDGIADAKPGPGVIDALEQSSTIVIAPSNPLLSIDPVLGLPGVGDVVKRRREAVVAVSPLIGGRAVKGPADRLMAELDHGASALGVARHYAPVARRLVVDDSDRDDVEAVERLGMSCTIAPTLMTDSDAAARLAAVALQS